MTPDEFKALEPGDIVRHVSGSSSYIVTATFGGRITAVLSADLTNPPEWELVRGNRQSESQQGEHIRRQAADIIALGQMLGRCCPKCSDNHR